MKFGFAKIRNKYKTALWSLSVIFVCQQIILTFAHSYD